jgi:hypothetical protein
VAGLSDHRVDRLRGRINEEGSALFDSFSGDAPDTIRKVFWQLIWIGKTGEGEGKGEGKETGRRREGGEVCRQEAVIVIYGMERGGSL